MKVVSRAALVASACAMLFFTACTNDGKVLGTNAAAEGGQKGSSSSDGSGVPGSPIQKEFSKVNIPPPPPDDRASECIKTHVDAPEPGERPQGQDASWVIALIDPSRSMGENCPKLGPGSECWVPFMGGWQVANSPSGSMVFQVFENDSTTPVRSPELGPIPPGGKFSWSTKLYYKPSADATKATFRVVLKNATGTIVAQSKPQTIDLPACIVDLRQEN